MLAAPISKANINLGWILVLLFLMLSTTNSTWAQPNNSMQDQGQAQASLDSLRREITKQILSDAEKKSVRNCDREKTEFLKTCREFDSQNALVTKQLNEAKMNSSNPNDPAIQILLEKKFNLEKKCDEKYRALPKGKACISQEAKRQKELEQVLSKNQVYQNLKKKADAVGAEHL